MGFIKNIGRIAGKVLDPFGIVNGAKDYLGGGKNPAEVARPLMNEVPQYGKDAYNPFIEQGKQAYNQLSPEYMEMWKNPGAIEDRDLADYEESEYFKHIFDRLMGGARNDAIANGSYGNDFDLNRRGELAKKLSGADIESFLQRRNNTRQMGREGLEGAVTRGFTGSTNLADYLGTAKTNQANLEYGGVQQQNQNKNQLVGDIIKAIAMYAGGRAGMPGEQQNTQDQTQQGQRQLGEIQTRGFYGPERGYGAGGFGGGGGGGYQPWNNTSRGL